MALNETIILNFSAPVAPSLEQVSLSLLSSTWKPNLVVSLISLFGVVTNSIVLVTIAKTKALHNKSQFVIFSHTSAEALYALLTFLNNFRRYIYAAFGIPDVMDQLSCIFVQIPLFVVSKVVLYAILALCIDRLLAIGVPIKYKTLQRFKYVGCLNGLCWGAVLIHVPFLFLYYRPGGVIPICTYGYAISPLYRTYESTEGFVIPAITIAAYSMAIGLVSYRYWGTKWQNEAQKTSWARQVQLGAFRIMMTVGCLYLSLWGISSGLGLALNRLDVATAATFGPYLALLNLLNTASHFFVYFSLSKTFRQSCKRAVFCRKVNAANSVGHIPTFTS